MEEAEALAAVRARFPELAVERASLLGGTHAPMFELSAASTRYVFRFPTTRAAGERIAAELRLLSAIRDRVPFAVPDHRFVADDMFGHEALPGASALSALASHDAVALRIRIAGMLDALRAAPVTVAWSSGVAMRKAQLAATWFSTQRDYARARPGLPPEIASACDHVVRTTRIPPPYTGAMVLTHGSLGGLTVTVGDSIGLSNWSEVCVADPALDLGALVLAFGGVSGVVDGRDPVVERAVFVAKCTGLAMVASSVMPLAAKRWACRNISNQPNVKDS
jgi:aminoglycoside phosphotransferase (APT) family kinase protein